MIKKILKSLLAVFALIFLVLTGLYFIPPKQERIQYDYKQIEKNPLLNSRVGWYKSSNNKNYQITWGSQDGLQLNYFDSLRNNLKNLRLTHIEGNKFSTDKNLKTVEVNFEFDNIDSISILNVKTSKTEFTATKLKNEFYKQEEVEYFNGDVRLAGLLMTPYNTNKSTAVVFIHGSGISDRNSFWYMHQANYLARNGYMVLLPDKRGCGKSEGEWHTASFQDFSDDITAALNYLSNNKKTEFSKKGVIGISQGGWISHLVNKDTKDLDFIIDVVGASTTPNEQLKFEIMNDIKNSGAPEFVAKPLSIVFAKRARGKRKIWWDKNGEFDPIPLMSKSDTKILKIFANEDENVPVTESQARIKELLKSNPSLSLDIKILENSGHALFSKNTNWIREDYLKFLNNWISQL
ncbi:MAG: alpha/beta fold hydrolase [Winogradskyella sp.]|uniref:alpha/beta hydrolase family protein n=1 Tax=Winogradskyella sp. TaxID=1883156 RepID=UPI000F3F164A|nr:alpha/beta fold hydrolase [Winogradskyella sp.]RNC87205.1 MAG: alpha/beta fold hydrolase [Winogradskyella sp.]